MTVQDGAATREIDNQCKRGENYARQECTFPQRMITVVIPVEGSKTLLSVKTCSAILQKLIFPCMAALFRVELSAPVVAGTVVLENVCGTGMDVIATKNM